MSDVNHYSCNLVLVGIAIVGSIKSASADINSDE